MTATDGQLARIADKIASFGKENLDEMLHMVGEGVRLVSSLERVRIYLEDLTRGALSCAYCCGPFSSEIREETFPIISSEAAVSHTFVTQQRGDYRNPAEKGLPMDRDFSGRFGIDGTTLFPVTSQGKSIGVVCVDGPSLPSDQIAQLSPFLNQAGERVDQARKYHQQLLLARRVELYKRREAAGFMVRSAVRLIDGLTLASVLVPADRGMEVLASHAEDPELKAHYETVGGIDLTEGSSLVSRYVNEHGIITDERLLKPLFIEDLRDEKLQRRALIEQMGLRTLYLVPRYVPETRRLICLINYYTREVSRFNDFEMGLLQTHAEMVERVINEVGGEHLEIKVLSEISDLLQERNEGLHPFLTKVLSKATELIGADTGSIAIVEEREGEKWLIVEDEEGNIVGAKNKEWLKKKIPPFKVGGPELSDSERSLTGFVAWAKQPKMIGRVWDVDQHEGFHRLMSELIKSEMAVPVIADDEVIAVICLNSLHEGYFTEEHKRILQLIDRLTSRHISDLKRIESLQYEVNRLQTDVAYKDPQVSSYRLGNIIGNSRKSQEIVEFINTVSRPLSNRIALWSRNVLQEATIGLPSILVQGQTGAGKEFFFNNLYNKLNELYRQEINPGGELPVKKTNIAAYGGDLTYSELFGHIKGAFTGAYSDRKGILEEASGGIVFLDEIGDADPKTQVQLLRFLDNGGFVRLGENRERISRVLLVAATNKDLQKEISLGRFREDLYHRLTELSVVVPSLNERREDIPDLATHFLGKLYRTYRSREEAREDAPLLSKEAKDALVAHHYKGNIRELRSILLRALFFRTGKVVTGENIMQAIRDGMRDQSPPASERLTGEVAQGIMEEIAAGSDFWMAVYEPYSKSQISRDVVRLVVEKCRAQAGKSMPEIARALKAVTGDPQGDEEERKRFFRFKNFLYKTVKI
ncbi:GPMC system transcriptional regulator [Geomesophilobacter sediminis]|uniref:GPMC system transcriptional regulator n=1 Tax=Geomesophilobacter sediminis TaxID=2798584 RepID=A0A8J7M0S4_9BACT|nr:GPMC system transcriptional regulator [Geomesophilobacter sediminis]MBJ6726493.1 GPMC system transcriptional regulator [Geomesophilobacter sediminis]